MLKIIEIPIKRVGESEIPVPAKHIVLGLKVIGTYVRQMTLLVDTDAEIINKKFLLINEIWELENDISSLKYLHHDHEFYLFEIV